jgi:hypothetical protein
MAHFLAVQESTHGAAPKWCQLRAISEMHRLGISTFIRPLADAVNKVTR